MSGREPLLGEGVSEGDAAFGYVYLSHLVSTFGDRMWQFAIPIIFMDIWPNTLFPCSLFMFINNIAQFLLLPSVGAWTDRHHRRLVIRTALFGQNGAIVACSIVLLLLVHSSEDLIKDKKPLEWNLPNVAAFAAITGMSIFGELLGKCSTSALEKDWVVVLCRGDTEALAKANARMRSIDLGSKVLAPLAFSIILQIFDEAGSDTLRLYIAAAIVGLWNMFSLPLEYIAIMSAYNRHAESLGRREISPAQSKRPRLKDVALGWRKYVKHPVFLASLSYCMLYLTVLDNGILMIAYLNYRNVPKLVLGGTRGVGAIFGLLGTCLYPSYLTLTGSLRGAASISLGLFALFITPAAVFFALEFIFEPSNRSDLAKLTPFIMMLAVNSSRCWLWIFDLAESQLLQEMVHESERGLISSVQNSMCQVFLAILGVLGMIFADATQFHYLVLIATGNVYVAFALFMYWNRTTSRPEA